MLNIGCCYDHLSEKIPSKNQKESSTLAQKALHYYLKQMTESDSEHKAYAALNIYSLCFHNKIAPLPDKELIYYLEIATEGGDREALNHLGVAYLHGNYSLTPDQAKAEQLFRKSMDQGNIAAKVNLMCMQYTKESSETRIEAAQLYQELWTEHPKEFKKYLKKIMQSVQNVLDSSEQEGSGEDGNPFQEIKEEKAWDEFNQQDLKNEQETVGSLASFSSIEEEYPETEEDWKKWSEQKKALTLSVQSWEETEQRPVPVSSKNEKGQQEERDRLQKKYERMMRRVESLPKKQAKYRKIHSLMNQCIQDFGGAIKNANGRASSSC